MLISEHTSFVKKEYRGIECSHLAGVQLDCILFKQAVVMPADNYHILLLEASPQFTDGIVRKNIVENIKPTVNVIFDLNWKY